MLWLYLHGLSDPTRSNKQSKEGEKEMMHREKVTDTETEKVMQKKWKRKPHDRCMESDNAVKIDAILGGECNTGSAM